MRSVKKVIPEFLTISSQAPTPVKFISKPSSYFGHRNHGVDIHNRYYVPIEISVYTITMFCEFFVVFNFFLVHWYPCVSKSEWVLPCSLFRGGKCDVYSLRSTSGAKPADLLSPSKAASSFPPCVFHRGRNKYNVLDMS